MSIYACCEHCLSGPHAGHERPCIVALCSGSLSTASEAPSSPAETTGADSSPSQRPPDSVAAESESEVGTNESAVRMNTYLNVISNLAPLSQPGHWVKFSTRCAIADACMAVADAEHAALTAEVERLNSEVTMFLTVWDETLDDLDAARRAIAEQEITIGRLGKVGSDTINLLTRERDAALAACQERHPAGRDLPDAPTEPALELEVCYCAHCRASINSAFARRSQ